MFFSNKSAPQHAVPLLATAWANRNGTATGGSCVFCVGDQPVVDSSAGALDGLLPLVAWHADNIYRYAMGGRAIGLTFRSDSKAMLGFRVDLSRIQQPTSEVMCFLLESLEDIYSNSPKSALVAGAVDIGELIGRFKSELELAMEQAGVGRSGALRSVSTPSAS